MHRTIEFPNIGIHLEHVGDHITVFGFDIAFYGIIIGLGILAGIFIAAAEAKRTGQKEEDYSLPAILPLPRLLLRQMSSQDGCPPDAP